MTLTSSTRTATFSRASKGRLTDRDLGRFPGDTLFEQLARAVCAACCLPRKELYEAWETARRVRRRFRGGRIVDVGSGHGLLAHILMLLDDSSPGALAIDPAIPPSALRLQASLVERWPRLAARVRLECGALEAVELSSADVVVASHACGTLADRIIDRAVEARARVAILPCCHDHTHNDAGALTGWLDTSLAIDVMRAVRLEQRGYRVWTCAIPSEITSKNRLLLGQPDSATP